MSGDKPVSGSKSGTSKMHDDEEWEHGTARLGKCGHSGTRRRCFAVEADQSLCYWMAGHGVE